MDLIGYDSDYLYEDPIPKKKKRKKGQCCYCRVKLNESNYTKEHLHPKSKGGKIIKPCCRECNSEKADMTLIEYREYLIMKRAMATPGTINHIRFHKKISSCESLLILHPNLMNL